MNDLTAWLRSQYDAREQQLAFLSLWGIDAVVVPGDHTHVLTEVKFGRQDIAAKRAILDLHAGEHDCPEMQTGTYPADWPDSAPWGNAGESWAHPSGEHFEADQPCPTVRLLARPFAGRDGWREEWAIR